AARRERHDDLHRLRRPRLGRGGRRAESEKQEGKESFHRADFSEALPRADLRPQIRGSTSLIDPGSTASAMSSNGVGWALTMTTLEPAARATSTVPAIGETWRLGPAARK